jgi:beta-N-acetylhexosaminidase
VPPSVAPAAPHPLPPGLRTSGSDHWADSVLATLTLRQKAAQMVWPNLFADYVSADSPSWQKLLRDVRDDGVGGLLMSIGSPIEMAVKLNALQRAAPVPLLIGADFEYGAGMRARGGYFLPNAIDLGGATIFPPQMAFGATRDTMLAYEEGRITALEGRALGVHIDFAPVLDVNNNPNNPVINTRSYGEDPRLVAAFGAAYIRGVQDHGMMATGKHFPGHGDTQSNSHLAFAVVTASRGRLDSVELVPFRAAIAAGVGSIMSFHGAMPALDSTGDPLTLSATVMTSLLRDRMGFDGLVVTDAMDMHGVLARYGVQESAKRAVAAGADILIQPVDAGQAIDAVVAGVGEGRYSERRLDASVRRILTLKHAMRLDRQRFVDLDSLRATVGDTSHLALAREVAKRSITLVKDSLHQLPLGRLTHATRVLSITVSQRSDLGAGVTFGGELRKTFPALRTEWIDANAPGDVPWRLLQEADSADVTIIGSYVGQNYEVATVSAPGAIAAFVRQLTERGVRPIVVSFGNPYFLQQVPMVPAYVVAWGGFPVSQQAAASAILGLTPVTGHLPISIPTYAPFGAGIALPGTESAPPR